MSELTIVNTEGKPLQRTVVDEKGSRIIEFDKDGNELIVSECIK